MQRCKNIQTHRQSDGTPAVSRANNLFRHNMAFTFSPAFVFFFLCDLSVYASSTWVHVTVLSVRLSLQAAAFRAQSTMKMETLLKLLKSTTRVFVSATPHKPLPRYNFQVTAEGYMLWGVSGTPSVEEILLYVIKCSVILHIKAEPWRLVLGTYLACSTSSDFSMSYFLSQIISSMYI